MTAAADRSRADSPAKPLLAVTMGDPAGVGPELSLRILADPSVLAMCTPLIFGDADVLARVAEQCKLPRPAEVISPERLSQSPPVAAPAVVDFKAIAAAAVQPGQVSADCGRAVYTYIEAAIAAATAGHVAAVVTNAINKESLNAAGVDFPGHTEIFAALTGAERVCMMLASEKITASFVTTHVGFVDVPGLLSRRRVLDVIELTDSALRSIKGRHPRLLVCGLNPHAGEHGLFGRREEQEVIEPAIADARAAGIDAAGPLPPDAAFLPARLADADAIICMYHDQGHIPFKMLAFDTGVNITLGLPIVRTSVDHGTAFDIAWQGAANPTSLIQAIRWAVALAAGRRGNKDK